MHIGRYIFAQITDFIPRYVFDKAVAKYKGDFHVKDLTCYNQLLHLLFGQITACDSLRDICLCLEAHKDCLYHLGFRNTITVSSLSRANENRDYRIYEELGQYLIKHVRLLYAATPLSDVTTDDTIYALDSTTISTSVKLASWALGKYSKGAVKVHTLLDLRGSIPVNIHITDGKWHDNNMWARLPIECGAIYTADKAYVDLAQMWHIQQAGAFFVMRPKNNMRFQVIQEMTDDRLISSVCADYGATLTGYKSKRLYPGELRIVKVNDPETQERVTFMTNIFDFNPLEIANIYRHRWDVEVFYKWLKQNVTIKSLWGYSENAVKTHIWVAISAYLLLAKIKAETKSPYSITEIATLIRVSALERKDLRELLTQPNNLFTFNQNAKEPNLFDNL